MEEHGKRPARGESPGQRLRRVRQQFCWSQEHLAELIGTSAKSINRWEHDKTVPQPHYRQQLSRVFNISLEDLFGRPQYEASQEEVLATTPIWHVPYQRNLFFTGREDILAHLHDLLNISKTSVPAPSYALALSGLGGIGKTQTALEYAYHFRQQYEAVLWLTADTVETLVAECVRLADVLDLQQKREQDQTRIMHAVTRWLETHRHWLLILDNVEDPTTIQHFLPSTNGGHILLTTQVQAAGILARAVDVGTLSLEEGTLFLLRRSRLLAPESLLDQAAPADRAAAEEIVQAMDGLPLALDQAGAYIEETGCGIAPYLALYQQQEPRLLARRGETGTGHPASIFTTLSLSFAQVERQSPAADLLRFCAFLSPDAIPEEMLVVAASHLGSHLWQLATDPLLLDESIAILRRFSLVRRTSSERTLTVHRLVQSMLISSLTEQAQLAWAERAVRALEQMFPADVDNVELWPQYELYLLQALHCADLIHRNGVTIAEAARLLHRTADYVARHALHQQAERLYQQALALRKKHLAAAHPDTAENLNDLANLYHMQGKYEQAESLYQQALAIWQQQVEPAHSHIATNLNDLTELYYEQGKYEQAESLCLQALAIWQQHLESAHPNIAQNLNDLAEIYRIQGKYEQAEPLYRQALTIWEQLSGPTHCTAICMNNLATLYRLQGKYMQAEPLISRALAIREQQLGSTHPQTASSLNNLAGLYRDQGKYDQAEPLYRQALAIWEQQLGPRHPRTATSTNDLAVLYRMQGKYEQAESLILLALSVREQQLGPTHPDTAQSLHELATLYRIQGRYEQSESLFKKALTIRKQKLGPRHPDTAQSYYGLALLYRDQGQYDQAAPLFQQALDIIGQTLGSNHPAVAEMVENFAVLP